MFRETPQDSYFFTQTEHNILKALCAYMVGTSNDAELDISVITIDAFVQQLSKPLRTRIRFGLHLFQWGPPLFIRKLRLFTQLDPRDAVRYIEGWARSRRRIRRQLFRGLRDIAFLGYYSDRQK
ncbi:MAG: hypothetical protein OXU36_02015 [Candidatus Poribacteria bacterium]|nr:hypothetical protein [Candidatus Poribacteria bacterium]